MLSIQLFPFLIMGLNIHAPFSVGRNVVVNRFRNKILIGYNYRTIKSLGYEGCLESCLGDCRCLSFQVCGFSNDCQLSNSSKTLINGSAVEDSTSCDHFEFNYQGMMKVEVNIEKCNEVQCVTDINCCLSSTPCYFRGTCIPSASQDRRFLCKCRPGFKGKFCEERIVSCRNYSDGNRNPGSYTILDKDDNPYMVFCDFNENSATAWTLVQSYSFENKNVFASPFTKNMPRNEDKFTWFDYRLSIERLAYIHEHSVKWRITCNYDTEGMKLFPDYVRAFIANISLFTLFDNNGQCVRVQRISIAGYSCKSCGAHMVQSNELPLHFHGEKSIECGFDEFPYHGNTHDQQQEYFGNYRDTNLLHTCSSSPSSTTQTWLA